MAFSNERKKEILLQSFNVLKKNIYENASDLESLIEKIADLDFNMALEMWKFILENYNRYDQYYNETYYITGGIISNLSGKFGIDKLSKFILEDQLVRNKLYNVSANVDDQVVAYLIDGNQLDKANDLLELIHSNVNFLRAEDEDRFGKYLHSLFYLECKNITEDKMDFIFSWVEKVPSEEGRAKLHVLLLEYM